VFQLIVFLCNVLLVPLWILAPSSSFIFESKFTRRLMTLTSLLNLARLLVIWFGIAENVGHAMTYKVLTIDTQKIIYHSNLHSASLLILTSMLLSLVGSLLPSQHHLQYQVAT